MHTRSRPARLAAGLLLATLGLTALSAAPAHAAGSDDISWGVAPADNTIGTGRPNFSYTLAGSTRITDGLVISNESAQAITLKVYAADGFTTSTGALDLKKPGQKSDDIGSWITVATESVTLAPHHATTVGFTVTVPGDASPGDHVGGVVTSLVTRDGSGALSLDRRLGSRVLLRVPGTVQPALKLGSVSVHYQQPANPFGGGTAVITYRVANTGNVRLAAAQEVTVSGPFGILQRSARAPNLPSILPGGSLTRSVTIHGVPPTGRLAAQLTLRPYSDGEPIAVPAVTAAASVWVMPWGLLIVVVVLALGVLLLVVLLRRRRRQRGRRSTEGLSPEKRTHPAEKSSVAV
ncbi:MAG TPA: DUF916 domain-containing protein [Gryllotalpicola sp.]